MCRGSGILEGEPRKKSGEILVKPIEFWDDLTKGMIFVGLLVKWVLIYKNHLQEG